MTAARPIILDTDPGIDDAMAIAVVLASPELDLLGLTTVFGNHDIDVTTANAQRVLDALGWSEVPVVGGAHRPLVRSGHGPATFVHGDDGLGDAGLPPPSRPPVASRHAAQHIVETVRGRPGEVTLVAVGPLTNLALALHLAPGIAGDVAEVVVMGGAARVPGNVTPTAEANIWNDPEAAELVFAAEWPVTMVGLDVTCTITAGRPWLDDMACVDTAAARLVTATAPAYVRFHQSSDGFEGIHCHDATAVAYLLRPDLFRVEPMAVRVVTDGFSAGATVATLRFGVDEAEWSGRRTVDVAVEADAPALLDLLSERLSVGRPAPS